MEPNEKQFVAAAATVLAPAKINGEMGRKQGTTSVYSGTPQDVMKDIASTGRLFQRHNEGPRSAIKEGDPKWGTEVSVSTNPGASPRDVANKKGRAEVAKDLKLPNKKEYRAKKLKKDS